MKFVKSLCFLYHQSRELLLDSRVCGQIIVYMLMSGPFLTGYTQIHFFYSFDNGLQDEGSPFIFDLLNEILEAMKIDEESTFIAALTNDIQILPDFHGPLS